MPDLITICMDEHNNIAITNEIDFNELSSDIRLLLYYAMEKYAAVGRMIEEEDSHE